MPQRVVLLRLLSEGPTTIEQLQGELGDLDVGDVMTELVGVGLALRQGNRVAASLAARRMDDLGLVSV